MWPGTLILKAVQLREVSYPALEPGSRAVDKGTLTHFIVENTNG